MNVASTTNMAGSIKYRLREPMTTEELYALMRERWHLPLPGGFQLKKGLFGSYIRFDTYMTMQPRVKVKDGVVKVSRVTVETEVNGMDLRAASQAINTLRHGGSMMDVVMAGPEYFLRVCAELENVLEGRIAEG